MDVKFLKYIYQEHCGKYFKNIYHKLDEHLKIPYFRVNVSALPL